jgi:hypothetical protein
MPGAIQTWRVTRRNGPQVAGVGDRSEVLGIEKVVSYPQIGFLRTDFEM